VSGSGRRCSSRSYTTTMSAPPASSREECAARRLWQPAVGQHRGGAAYAPDGNRRRPVQPGVSVHVGVSSRAPRLAAASAAWVGWV
jgi:hypothetical protein